MQSYQTNLKQKCIELYPAKFLSKKAQKPKKLLLDAVTQLKLEVIN